MPGPDELEPDDWGTMLERRPIIGHGAESVPGVSRTWLRVKEPVVPETTDGAQPSETLQTSLQLCAHVFASDDIPTDAAISLHPKAPMSEETWGDFIGASLDHAVWLHRPRPATEWMLHDFTGLGMQGGRGLAMGRVFAQDGTHVASIAQEVLFREKKPA